MLKLFSTRHFHRNGESSTRRYGRRLRYDVVGFYVIESSLTTWSCRTGEDLGAKIDELDQSLNARIAEGYIGPRLASLAFIALVRLLMLVDDDESPASPLGFEDEPDPATTRPPGGCTDLFAPLC